MVVIVLSVVELRIELNRSDEEMIWVVNCNELRVVSSEAPCVVSGVSKDPVVSRDVMVERLGVTGTLLEVDGVDVVDDVVPEIEAKKNFN